MLSKLFQSLSIFWCSLPVPAHPCVWAGLDILLRILSSKDVCIIEPKMLHLEIHGNLGQGKETQGSRWTFMWISGGLWWMWIWGAGLVAEFAPVPSILSLPEPAPLVRSSITPTKPNVSPTYPKHGNRQSLRALSLNKSSESGSGNWRQTPGIWLLPYHVGWWRSVPRAASAGPTGTGDVPAPSQEVLSPPCRLWPHSSYF